MSAYAPNGVAPDAQARVNGALLGDAGKPGIAIHSFDPDASPQEKAALASKGRDALKSPRRQQLKEEGAELAVDAGASHVVPTITISDVEEETLDDNKPGEPHVSPPGGLPAGAAPEIPDWYKVGWRAVSGIDDVATEGERHDRSVLATYVEEQYYGEWYHSAALIFFAISASHFLTRFGFGVGWLFLVLAACNTYYTVSMERFRRSARDDIQRELVKTRLASESESADWINHFLDRFWLIYEPVLSATIISTVDQVLTASTPPFLESLRLSTFTLGNKAPRIDQVRTFPNTQDDIVMMDWGISFTPNDLSDVTPREQAYKANPKVVLSIKLGTAGIGATIPVLLEDIAFRGLLRIRLKLMTPFPHVQIVDISFLEKPVIDFVLRPLGGDSFDINHIPGLQAFIRDTLHSTLGPMMYEPNVFTLNLEQMLSGAALDTAVGVLQITVDSARGIKSNKMGGGSPDPYVSLSINERKELAKTKYKHSTYNPTWHETKFILVNSLTEQLVLTLMDYNDHRKDTTLGQASFDLSKLIEDAEHENVEQPILHDGKDRGMLRYHVSFYPVLKPQALIEGGEAELPDTTVGIVRLTVHQAKELDQTKTQGEVNPSAQVFLGDSDVPQFVTNKLKHTTAPVWEAATEFLCADKHASVVTIKIIDDRDFLRDGVVGYMSVRLVDLLAAKAEAGRDWWPLSNCKSGRVRLSAEWKPLNMAGSLHGADAYTPPIGAVRLWIQKAVDVKNVEATLGGKSDPYVRVQVAHVTLGRTEVINNNLNPEWDQIIYIPVHSLRETLMLECMDYQHLTKDRSLGTVEVRVSELVKESDDPDYPYASTGKKTAADPIRLDKGGGYKGKLHYVAEFVPALALSGVRFDGVKNEVQRAVEQGQGDDDGDVVENNQDSSAVNIKTQAVPVGVTVSRPTGPDGHKRSMSTDTAVTTATVATAKDKYTVTLTKDELLQHQSGILVCNVLRGMLAKRARLEVLLDDGYWPAFSTVKPRSTHANWDIIGEGVIKELDFGRVWLRLNDADEGDKDDIISEWRGDAKEFLQKTLEGSGKFTLTDADNRGTSTIEIESRFVPLPLKLEARESVNNQGMLRVELVDGRDIIAADRGGKSDPFAVFSLNGSRVFKSQTKKKTLAPEWNETFITGVSSRVAANFEIEIFDWNQIEQAKSLGSAKIELGDLEPFQGVERVLPLSHTRYGDKGEVRVRLTFQPEVIAKSRKNTSTFSVAGRAMTQLGGLPVGGAKGVATGVGKVFRKDHAKANASIESYDPVASPPAGQASFPIEPSVSVNGSAKTSGTSSLSVITAPTAFPSASAGSLEVTTSEPGTLRLTILSAKDLSAEGEAGRPYVTVRIGDKEHKTKHVSKTTSPEWNESFTFLAGTFTPKAFVWVYDHKTLGKDKLLGEGEIDIWRHIQPRGQTAADVMLELRAGQGLLQARLEFDPDARPVQNTTRSKSPDPANGGSPSRFSMSRRRLPMPADDASQ